jgi:hypothetical protein
MLHGQSKSDAKAASIKKNSIAANRRCRHRPHIQ